MLGFTETSADIHRLQMNTRNHSQELSHTVESQVLKKTWDKEL